MGKSHQDDTGPLTRLIADACRTSLAEHLGILATAAERRGRGLPFDQEMLACLKG